MHTFHFSRLKIKMAEGCCDQHGGKTLQYVRISLHSNNGRRRGAIPRIIDEYNNTRMDGCRQETVIPVIFFPGFQETSIHCFKSTAPAGKNPILKRIASAKQGGEEGFWRWTSSSSSTDHHHEGVASTAAAALSSLSHVTASSSSTNHDDFQQNKRRHNIISAGGGDNGSITSSSSSTMISIHDILLDMQLVVSENAAAAAVSVHRVYDELSEPYFIKFGMAMGEGTGCVPLEHRDFIVSEIKRLFEEELSYIQQPPVLQGELPSHARSLVDDADGWMGDILLSGDGRMMEMIAGGPMIHAVRVENAKKARRKGYVRTGRNQSDRLERSGVGALLREFLVFYALKWNDAGLESVHQSIESLHSGWTDAKVDFNTLRSLLVGMGLASSYALVEESSTVLRIPSVERLLGLLSKEGLITTARRSAGGDTIVTTTASSSVIQRMTVKEDCAPVASIVKYFQDMLLKREWIGVETAEVTATDIVKALNGGSDVGVYRRSCVSQFMRPFIFDGSVEAYFWRESGGAPHEKYVIHVARVAQRLRTL